MIHLLVPMSGQGVRYQKAGYKEPKPLIPVNGKTMLSRVLECFPQEWPTHFVMAENHKQTKLPDLCKDLRPRAIVQYIPEHKEGPAKAIEAGLKNIPDNDAVFVSYCDYGMVWDVRQFERFVEQTDCDGCLVSYRGFHAHYLSPTKYAYSRLEGERVVEVREKGSFTDNRENEFASCGGYYFKSAKNLKAAIAHQRQKNLAIGGEFYTSLTMQALIETLSQPHVRVFEIPGFFQWGTPEDLQRFEYWEKTFASYNKYQGQKLHPVEQTLMPMAGLGSRFKNHTTTPKPLIRVDQTPMFLKAQSTLPAAKNKSVFVTLKQVESQVQHHLKSLSNATLVALQETPSGQALTTAEGAKALDQQKPVVVSSCDHGIVLSPELWHKFQAAPDCEAAIFTIKGFPGANAKPEAFAYVVPQNSDTHPLVKHVSVKKPVSDQPGKDHLLVGTFWFQSAALLQEVIAELVKKDIRVNNELYLDSVFELLLQKNKKVRMIPLDGYINWGDPDSLAEALYWYEVFCAQRISKRPRFPGVE